LTGAEGLAAILGRLEGFELPARAWERAVLPARLDRYDASMLDTLCLTGQIGWARLSAPRPADPGSTRGLRVALFARERAEAWRALFPLDGAELSTASLRDLPRRVLDVLNSRGPLFLSDVARVCEIDAAGAAWALATLAAERLVTSDGFAGARLAIRALAQTSKPAGRRHEAIGRWFALPKLEASSADREAAVDMQARTLLGRYGVVFRRLLARETNAAEWRELARVYRRLEARGEIRGGRFVTGVTGEQFALPDAVERLREIRRSAPHGRLLTISAADPLNLIGILTSGERVRAVTASRVIYRDGIALAVQEGGAMRPLVDLTPDDSARVAGAVALPALELG
jgi:ATP-dependent Lhr-like helicase